MRETTLKEIIECSVTNGLGYYSETDFTSAQGIYQGLLSNEEVKNTPEGLQAHLFSLSIGQRSLSYKGITLGNMIKGSTGRNIRLLIPTPRLVKKLYRQNLGAIRRANMAQGKRRGGFLKLILEKALDVDYIVGLTPQLAAITLINS